MTAARVWLSKPNSKRPKSNRCPVTRGRRLRNGPYGTHPAVLASPIAKPSGNRRFIGNP
jgi:hypothetical protein